MTGAAETVQPAFTVWNSGASPTYWYLLGHQFSQIADEKVGTFVGFANNSSDPYFGDGPENISVGGSYAVTGVVSSVGVDEDGNNYAELSFSNLTAGTWYAIAAGGSGGTTGDYSITANLSPTAVPVPVPGAIWLFGTAMAGLVGVGGRRKVD